ncbi:hypothetical protein ACLB2K_077569 [Fragaria x ananassa]
MDDSVRSPSYAFKEFSCDQLLAAGAITVPLVPFIVSKVAMVLSFIAFGLVSFIARTVAMIFSSVREILRRIRRRRMYRKLLKSPKKKKSRRSEIPDSPPSQYAPGLGSTSASPSERLFPSYFHTRPERRAVSRRVGKWHQTDDGESLGRTCLFS